MIYSCQIVLCSTQYACLLLTSKQWRVVSRPVWRLVRKKGRKMAVVRWWCSIWYV